MTEQVLASTMAAAKLILDAGKRPRRTIRLVLWGAEEQGIHGGKAYLERHRSELRNHMLASESDFGAGLIWQITSNVSSEGQPVIDLIGTLLNPLGIVQGGKDIFVSGPDLYPMIKKDSHRLVFDKMERVTLMFIIQPTILWIRLILKR